MPATRSPVARRAATRIEDAARRRGPGAAARARTDAQLEVLVLAARRWLDAQLARVGRRLTALELAALVGCSISLFADNRNPPGVGASSPLHATNGVGVIMVIGALDPESEQHRRLVLEGAVLARLLARTFWFPLSPADWRQLLKLQSLGHAAAALERKHGLPAKPRPVERAEWIRIERLRERVEGEVAAMAPAGAA